MNPKFVRDIVVILDDMDIAENLSMKRGSVSYYVMGLNNFSAYVRFISSPLFRPDRYSYVLANIESSEPGQGFFTSLLPFLKEKCKKNDWNLEVENVLNEKFLDYLLRNGFKEIEGTNPICVIWDGRVE